jgi:hypothetical protein
LTSTATAPLAKLSPSSCRWLKATADGEWMMTREEDDASTWVVAHLPERVIVADYMASLTECRAYVASGEAQADLERLTVAAPTGEGK